MIIDIEIHRDHLSQTPLDSRYLHLTILCGALKYCLGPAKKMSFIKLGYIFDKTIILEAGAFKSKLTLSAWSVGSTYKKALIFSEANNFIEITDNKSKGILINISENGDDFIRNIEKLDVFNEYIEYIKEINITESRFDDITIRPTKNVY